MNSILPGTETKYQLEQVRSLITMNNLNDALGLLKREVVFMADMILGGLITIGLLFYLGYSLIKAEDL